MRDAEDPAREAPRGVERRQVAEGLDEGLLREVLSQAGIVCDAGDQVDNRTLISADDLLEGGLGARQRLRDQAGLGYGIEVNRDGEVLCNTLRRSIV